MNYKLYLVGGIIRDRFLGLPSKDYDFSVVVEDLTMSPKEAFDKLEIQLKQEGYEIFLSTPECFTIRARFPKDHKHNKLTADFVLARKDEGYIGGTRRPNTVLGTLEDDLRRRDFTVNAMAEDMEGDIVDPFNGQLDLQEGTLRTPVDASVSFMDDPLRILRAMRFKITKSMMFSDDVVNAIQLFPVKRMSVVSDERIREELRKMFMADTLESLNLIWTIRMLNPALYTYLFSRMIKLEPTMKKS